jgi:hypothetical protein
MDRRAQARFPADQPLRVSMVTPVIEPLVALVVNVSRTGVRLLLERPVAHGTALKLEWEDDTLFGSVVYCEGIEAQYAIGLKLEQPLPDTQLARFIATGIWSDPGAA